MRILFLILNLISFNLFADLNYSFKTELDFYLKKTMVPGIFEQFSLIDNESVTLNLILLENKMFLSEVQTFTDEQLKSKFLLSVAEKDVFFNQENRQVLEFSLLKVSDSLKIKILYSFTKNNELFKELAIYVLQKNDTAVASIEFPDSLDSSFKKKIHSSIDKFEIKKKL